MQHVLTALAATSALFMAGVGLAGSAQAAAPTYEPDTNAAGTVALYNASGVQVTSGSTTAHPFAAYIAGSGGNIAGSPAGSSAATAYAATPQDGVNSQLWGNDTLTATTPFGTATSAAYPGALKNSSNAIAKATSSDFSLADYIEEFPAASTANPNVYQIRISTGNPSKYYTADVQVTGSTWTQVYPTVAGPATTSTTVTASPASPSTAGTSVTFTATVSPSGAAGTVQFKDGANNLGTAATVAGGTATTTTSALSVGSHDITAVFTPTDTAAYAASTSAALTYVVNAPPATATTTSLAVAPAGPVDRGTVETLTATVTPTAAAGTVQFKDGTADIGAAATVTGGTASTTTTLPTGTHSLTAVFTPTDTAAYAASTSTAVSYVVNAALPGTPSAIAASSGNGASNVTWTAPTDNGGSPITGYDLEVSTDGTTWADAAGGTTQTSTATSKVVGGLTNGTGYFFRVAAINAIGTGAYDATTTKATPVADATKIAISATSSVRYGSLATISAVVTNARTNLRVAGAVLALYRRSAGQSTYSLVRTVTAGSTGVATFQNAPASNSSFQWRFAGNASYTATNSGLATVNVVPVISIAATPTVVAHGQLTRIYGTATPATSGERTLLQRAIGGKWVTQLATTVRLQKLPNGKTAVGYIYAQQLKTKGTYVFRVVTAVNAASLAGYSSAITVRAS